MDHLMSRNRKRPFERRASDVSLKAAPGISTISAQSYARDCLIFHADAQTSNVRALAATVPRIRQ